MSNEKFLKYMEEMKSIYKLKECIKYGSVPNWIEYSFNGVSVVDLMIMEPKEPNQIEFTKVKTNGEYRTIREIVSYFNKDDIRRLIEEAINNIRIEEMEKV